MNFLRFQGKLILLTFLGVNFMGHFVIFSSDYFGNNSFCGLLEFWPTANLGGILWVDKNRFPMNFCFFHWSLTVSKLELSVWISNRKLKMQREDFKQKPKMVKMNTRFSTRTPARQQIFPSRPYFTSDKLLTFCYFKTEGRKLTVPLLIKTRKFFTKKNELFY